MSDNENQPVFMDFFKIDPETSKLLGLEDKVIVRQNPGATIEIGERAQDHDYVQLDVNERSISPGNPIYPYDESLGLSSLEGMEKELSDATVANPNEFTEQNLLLGVYLTLLRHF